MASLVYSVKYLRKKYHKSSWTLFKKEKEIIYFNLIYEARKILIPNIVNQIFQENKTTDQYPSQKWNKIF